MFATILFSTEEPDIFENWEAMREKEHWKNPKKQTKKQTDKQ